jgi:hypothetical protein
LAATASVIRSRLSAGIIIACSARNQSPSQVVSACRSNRSVKRDELVQPRHPLPGGESILAENCRVPTGTARADGDDQAATADVVQGHQVLGRGHRMTVVGDITQVPSRRVLVAVAAATSVGNVPNHGSFLRSRHDMWS